MATGIASTIVILSLVAIITQCGQPPPLTGDASLSGGGGDVSARGSGDDDVARDWIDNDAGLQDEELRLRALSDEGIFIVYDAALPANSARTTPGYLAYWLDSATGRPFIYDRLIMTRVDVGAALLDLERDLVIDVDTLAGADPLLALALNDVLASPDAGASPDPTAPHDAGPHWYDVTYDLAFEIMGFSSGESDPDLVTPVVRRDLCCPEAPVKAVLPPMKAPEPGTSPEKVVTTAMALCDCGGF